MTRYERLNEELLSLPGSGAVRYFSAPGRTELIGNHTDHNRGVVLAASVQLDMAASVKTRDDNVVILRTIANETNTGFPDAVVDLNEGRVDGKILPLPAEKGKTEALIRGIAAQFAKQGRQVGGFSAVSDSLVPGGSGLSSSAAVESLIGKIFDSLYPAPSAPPREILSSIQIAQFGQAAENEFFGKPCGLEDQIACASGGCSFIDFADAANPKLETINLDLSAFGYSLCVVNTGGSHADLTDDYAAVPLEMKAVAQFFGKELLRECEKDDVLHNAKDIRKTCGDRALMRALHFFDENERVKQAAEALRGDNFPEYLSLVRASGESSERLLQNIYAPKQTREQGVTLALALSRDFLRKIGGRGRYKDRVDTACRVHGGGFAGTIAAYMPATILPAYTEMMEGVFGAGSVTPLQIRPDGAMECM
ncbi:MAG: galactokinase [Spirochaetaceae bacterium]|jgi:galactokinase|nr:galactokinase [Spirochaetaceae bacterium]